MRGIVLRPHLRFGLEFSAAAILFIRAELPQDDVPRPHLGQPATLIDQAVIDAKRPILRVVFCALVFQVVDLGNKRGGSAAAGDECHAMRPIFCCRQGIQRRQSFPPRDAGESALGAIAIVDDQFNGSRRGGRFLDLRAAAIGFPLWRLCLRARLAAQRADRNRRRPRRPQP